MSDRPRFWDYWSCTRCGLEIDRRNEWEMLQVENHSDKHDEESEQ